MAMLLAPNNRIMVQHAEQTAATVMHYTVVPRAWPWGCMQCSGVRLLPFEAEVPREPDLYGSFHDKLDSRGPSIDSCVKAFPPMPKQVMPNPADRQIATGPQT